MPQIELDALCFEQAAEGLNVGHVVKRNLETVSVDVVKHSVCRQQDMAFL